MKTILTLSAIISAVPSAEAWAYGRRQPQVTNPGRVCYGSCMPAAPTPIPAEALIPAGDLPAEPPRYPQHLKRNFLSPKDQPTYAADEVTLVAQQDGSYLAFKYDGGAWRQVGRQVTVFKLGRDGEPVETKLIAMEVKDELGRVKDHMMYEMGTGQKLGSWEKEVSDRFKDDGSGKFVEKPEAVLPAPKPLEQKPEVLTAPRPLQMTPEEIVNEALKTGGSGLSMLAQRLSDGKFLESLAVETKIKLIQRLDAGGHLNSEYKALARLISSNAPEFSSFLIDLLGEPNIQKDPALLLNAPLLKEDFDGSNPTLKKLVEKMIKLNPGPQFLAAMVGQAGINPGVKAMAAGMSPPENVNGAVLDYLRAAVKGNDDAAAVAAFGALEKHPWIFHAGLDSVSSLRDAVGISDERKAALKRTMRAWLAQAEEIKASGNKIDQNWSQKFDSDPRTVLMREIGAD